MGIGFTPPYLAPTTVGPVILKGVNYASGAGGILNLTGKLFVSFLLQQLLFKLQLLVESNSNKVHVILQGDRINFDAQLDNFANTRQDIISNIGVPTALNLFKRSIFSVAMGSNDFINNYLAPAVLIYEKNLASPELFVTTLVSRFREQLIVIFLTRPCFFIIYSCSIFLVIIRLTKIRKILNLFKIILSFQSKQSMHCVNDF